MWGVPTMLVWCENKFSLQKHQGKFLFPKGSGILKRHDIHGMTFDLEHGKRLKYFADAPRSARKEARSLVSINSAYLNAAKKKSICFSKAVVLFNMVKRHEKGTIISVKCTEQERQLVEDVSARLGLSKSALLRQLFIIFMEANPEMHEYGRLMHRHRKAIQDFLGELKKSEKKS